MKMNPEYSIVCAMATPVAQVSNLPYRSASSLRTPADPDAALRGCALPIGNRRPSRLETCATAVRSWTLVGLAALFCTAASAAPFSAGSTGALGDLVVSNNLTLPLPPDGIFHFNSITVQAAGTLTFTRNLLNTPVYLLAKSNVTINGVIDVNGKYRTVNYSGGEGGPGGYDGGSGGFISGTNTGMGGAGMGPGAGLRGLVHGSIGPIGGGGAFRTRVSWNGQARSGTNYGNPLLLPLVGGSGGGGMDGNVNGGGGGGGGAVLIASDTVIRVQPGAIIRAIGGRADGVNQGSGGAIRLVSPRVYGSGTLQVQGGDWGGHGYIRIDSVLRTEPGDLSQNFALTLQPADSATLGGNMVVFPPNLPKLDIVGIGTNTIPVGVAGPVFFTFDLDAPTNQTVTIQARNFGTNAVPIEVALIPDSGEKTTYPAVINNSANPGEVVVPVTVTPNTRVQVQAWIR